LVTFVAGFYKMKIVEFINSNQDFLTKPAVLQETREWKDKISIRES